MIKPKPQAKRVPPKLKSQILKEILLANASIPVIAKRYDLSATTLYGWRSNHDKEISQNLKRPELLQTPENNFIELLPQEDVVPQEQDLSPLGKAPLLTPEGISNPITGDTPNDSKSTNSKLSEISLIFNNNTSLLLKGTINSSSLIKIINCLEEESC